MESTWKLLDEWQAPEPSAFFDAKLYARLRVEQAAPPASFFERAKAWLLYRNNLQIRPLAAGALATVLAGGRRNFRPARLPAGSLCDSDLGHGARFAIFDGNAQMFQQLNAFDGDEDSGPGASN